jgi:predicted nucleotidyltransferase
MLALMALLDRGELIGALKRLGQLAALEGQSIELLIVGGAVMVMEFGSRLSTRDLDGIVTNNIDRALVRSYVATVAQERGWPHDWLNDAAKGFIANAPDAVVMMSALGIRVSRPALEQLLAMKLCAWRDDTDVADAARLLAELRGNNDEIWAKIEPHLQLGQELKARYAFEDLCDSRQ